MKCSTAHIPRWLEAKMIYPGGAGPEQQLGGNAGEDVHSDQLCISRNVLDSRVSSNTRAKGRSMSSLRTSQKQFLTSCKVQESRTRCHATSKARSLSKAESPSMPSWTTMPHRLQCIGFDRNLLCKCRSLHSWRTTPYIFQCTGFERYLSCKGQSWSSSKGGGPEHFFSRTSISTNILKIGTTPYLVQTRNRDSFILKGPKARAYIHDNQIYYKLLIVDDTTYVERRKNLNSLVLGDLRVRAPARNAVPSTKPSLRSQPEQKGLISLQLWFCMKSSIISLDAKLWKD